MTIDGTEMRIELRTALHDCAGEMGYIALITNQTPPMFYELIRVISHYKSSGDSSKWWHDFILRSGIINSIPWNCQEITQEQYWSMLNRIHTLINQVNEYKPREASQVRSSEDAIRISEEKRRSQQV